MELCSSAADTASKCQGLLSFITNLLLLVRIVAMLSRPITGYVLLKPAYFIVELIKLTYLPTDKIVC